MMKFVEVLMKEHRKYYTENLINNRSNPISSIHSCQKKLSATKIVLKMVISGNSIVKAVWNAVKPYIFRNKMTKFQKVYSLLKRVIKTTQTKSKKNIYRCYLDGTVRYFLASAETGGRIEPVSVPSLDFVLWFLVFSISCFLSSNWTL